jgi:hypothetical protein
MCQEEKNKITGFPKYSSFPESDEMRGIGLLL